MGLFTKLRLGDGALKPELRAALESEGVVLVEEGLPGSITYEHFKAPGRRHHGKVVGEGLGLGFSEQRLALYCRSGSVKLIDKPFTEPQLSALEVSLERDDTVALRIDYDRAAVPKVSGQMTSRAVTLNAASVVEQLSARLGPQG